MSVVEVQRVSEKTMIHHSYPTCTVEFFFNFIFKNIFSIGLVNYMKNPTGQQQDSNLRSCNTNIPNFALEVTETHKLVKIIALLSYVDRV